MNQKTLNKIAVILLAEGTVRMRKRDASIVFTNTSPVLQKLFINLANELGFEVKRKSEKQFVIYSKDLAKKLFEECDSFRSKPCASGERNACPVTRGTTKLGASCSKCKPILFGGKQFPPERFPESVINSSINDTAEYLNLFCSCEGGVVVGSDVRNDEIIVRVGHPILREQVLKMFRKLEIEARLRGESLVFIRKRSEIRKFREKVGFVEGLKPVRGFHKSVSKNKLVDFIIDRHSFVQTARQAI